MVSDLLFLNRDVEAGLLALVIDVAASVLVEGLQYPCQQML